MSKRAIKVTQPEINAWVVRMLRYGGVRVIDMKDSNGLLNVPGKYCRVIDAMHVAIVSVAIGAGLPELIPPEPKQKRAKVVAPR